MGYLMVLFFYYS